MTISGIYEPDKQLVTTGLKDFEISFEFIENSHIAATMTNLTTEIDTELVNGVDFTVSGTTLTTTVQQPVGDQITMYLDMPFIQLTDYINTGDLDLENIEADYDTAVLERQQLLDTFNRSLTVPVTSDLDPEDLVDDLYAAEANAAASASAAADSETAAGVSADEAAASAASIEKGLEVGNLVQLIDDGGGEGVFPTAVVGLTTPGDILHVSAASKLARLAKGAANYKLFMNAAGLLPEWGVGVKIGSFTRATTTGTQAVTGVGFKPSHIIFIANLPSSDQMSIGFDDGTAHLALYDSSGISLHTYNNLSTDSIVLLVNVSTAYQGQVQSLDADGFTVDWVLTGAISSTANVSYIAFR